MAETVVVGVVVAGVALPPAAVAKIVVGSAEDSVEGGANLVAAWSVAVGLAEPARHAAWRSMKHLQLGRIAAVRVVERVRDRLVVVLGSQIAGSR